MDPTTVLHSLSLQKSCQWIMAIFLCALIAPTNTDRLGDAMSYLEKYNYIGQKAVDPNLKLSPAEIRGSPKLTEALREFQRVAGLPQTGVVDDRTLEMMRKPRCGIPDIYDESSPQLQRRRGKRYALLGSKWKKHEVTYSVTRYTPKLTRYEVEFYLQKAFQVWMEVVPLKFTPVHASHKADIEIMFGSFGHDDPYPFDGRGNTLAHAFTPGEGLAGDVHFDESEFWIIRDHEQGSDFFTVAVHEIGHALGLSHSYAAGSIMRPFYEYVKNIDNVLTNDDIAGIQYLYGPPNGYPTTAAPTAAPGATLFEYPTTPTTTVPSKPPVRRDLPEFCRRQVHFDAVFSTNGGITYAFEGWQHVYVWHGNDLEPSGPKRISDVFHNLHWGVDTAFSIKRGSKELIFILKLWFVWVYDASTLRLLRAQVALQDVFPDLPNRMDAAFRWNHDGSVYAFKGGDYWKLNHVNKYRFKAEPGYPRHISDWNLPYGGLKAAMSWAINGRTYFFFGNQYYKYHDRKRKIVKGYPRSLNVWWLGCPDIPKGLNLGSDLDALEGGSESMLKSTSSMHIITLMTSILAYTWVFVIQR